MDTRHHHVSIPLFLLLAGALACSSATQPRANVTLLVTNTTCTPGPCTPLRIRAFPGMDVQPRTPGGLWSLDVGTVTTASACLTLPSTAGFYVIAAATNDTTTFTWTNADPMALGALGPTESALQASPDTREFVAAGAQGWSVALPGGATLAPADACTP